MDEKNGVKDGKVSPNQGVKLSLKNSLVVSLNPLFIPGGLIVGLHRGGSVVIKHYALRRILWLHGYTPFKFIKFLDQCSRLILLKKVGGGYIFIHRMLVEYFAELDTPKNSAVGR